MNCARKKGNTMRVKPTYKNGGVVELGANESQMPVEASTAFRLQKILVPTDFSGCSRKALQYAIPFAKQFGAELHLLYVMEPCVAAAPELGPVDVMPGETGRTALEKLARSVGKSVQASASLRVGTAHVEIARAAKEMGADLIIIATHGRKGVERMFLGSTAETAVRHAPCPVLIVREAERDFVISEMEPLRRQN